MAIFKGKKTEKEKKVVKETSKVSGAVSGAKKKKKVTRREDSVSHFSENLAAVLISPRITEKATFSAENNVYVFNIMPRATKSDVIKSVEHFYKVTPAKVNIAKIPSKTRMSRAKRIKGVKSGGRKAYVYLKKGDSIEIV